jgi:exodeoxyribonuclease V alpha subunit
MDDGHCGLPHEELLTLTRQLLEVPAELVETALGLELHDGTVTADDLDGRRCVFLAGLYRAERKIAEKLNALAAGRPPWPMRLRQAHYWGARSCLVDCAPI